MCIRDSYLTVCAHNEHFFVYRQIVRDEIEQQLAEFKRQEPLLRPNFSREVLKSSQEGDRSQESGVRKNVKSTS
jgi:hypothetical protein